MKQQSFLMWAGLAAICLALAAQGQMNTQPDIQIVPALAPHGTPQAWLDASGLAGDPASAELADPDGDGQPSWREFVAGTSPTNASSVLALTASLTAEGPVRLGFFAGLGRRFQVESSDDLQAWAAVGSPVAGHGRPVAVLDDRPRAGVAGRSYRVRVLGVAARPGMAWIPPGTFTMGSPDSEPGRSASEGPQRRVAITREFWLGRTEVTQGEYLALLGENPAWFFGDTNLPVENVTWMDATNYCAKLTARERAAGNLPRGYEYRLPTEAEWEYACRAGTTTATAFGDSLSARQANFDGNYPYGGGLAWTYRERTQAVGYFPANGWGLADMHGNVLEWCQDWYASRLDWDANAVVADPQGPPAGTERVVRGGAWRSRGEDCRSAWRTGTSRWNANYALGFRVALGPVAGYGQGVIAGSVVWQGGDEPLPEVAIGLYDLDNPPAGNQPAAWLAATVTGLDGSYIFTNLPPGNYGVWPQVDAGGLRFQWETNSASPQVALVAGTNTVNFTAEDVSLFEGSQFKVQIWVVNIPSDVVRPNITMDQRRRYWAACAFPGFYDAGAIERTLSTTTNDTPAWKSATFELKADYGYYAFLWIVDNSFLVRLYDNGKLRSERFLVRPVSGCPEDSLFTWDWITGELKAVDRLNRPGMVWIPPGTFAMGSPASEMDRWSDEGPQTEVTITKGFWMSQFETTQAEYQSVLGSNPSYRMGNPQRPVEQVSWHDATNYCAKLTERERLAGRLEKGYVYRLPTEAEWEYACRAGTATRFSHGDDLNYTSLGDYAWYNNNSGGQTHPVGKKLPNAWGLYDMHGNVWEWCQTWYTGAYPGGSVADPQGPNTGSDRVGRGGSWGRNGGDCRTAYRYSGSSGNRNNYLGFRSVLAPGQ